jgi:tRNA threonylcarbamoyladenosine biosynthesis protein TsaB
VQTRASITLSRLHILALDTTTRAGSIAVARDDALLFEGAGDTGVTHGQRLPGDMARALDRAGIRVADLDLLAVAAGPGSFTGLRVGIAAIQGLAVACSIKVVAVPTLEALAQAARGAYDRERLLAPWMDGQRGEVFGAVFAALAPEGGETPARIAEIRAAIAGRPAEILDAWALSADQPIAFIGDGAERYRSVLEDRFRNHLQVLATPRLAPTLALLAFEEPDRAVPPHDIEPVYVRRPDAELARDRKTSSHGRHSTPRTGPL